MLGLPEGKVIRDTYLNTFGTMSNPDLRAKFQGMLTLATVGVAYGSDGHVVLFASAYLRQLQ
jgi:hypothetical protein